MASQNRLGYVHMLDMSAQSLDQRLIDLDSESPEDGRAAGLRSVELVADALRHRLCRLAPEP
jgi:hypothetical protein